ncbi:uncharacterized protein VTP21DRAFT_5368 [Calcarisporiella thermophila]|uniref:uncharacterized protein n=1 Tax=Calcarisporiella thermophila TaxID=911321 RepID=UPI0037447004
MTAFDFPSIFKAYVRLGDTIINLLDNFLFICKLGLGMLSVKFQLLRAFSSSITSPLRLAIVGSGPAGFYTAQKLLKEIPSAQIDMYEALPVPHGLVRYGVAPDHPEVKNCMNRFDEVAGDPRFSFYGNVLVASHSLPLSQLRSAYHATILAYGASQDTHLGIPNESAPGVFSARAFVGWYNGLPEHRDLPIDLERVETVAVVGMGNVALDVARLLLMPVEEVAKTDVTEHALKALRASNVKRVVIVGRRGPLQVAFTAKELREMMRYPLVLDRELLHAELQNHAEFLSKNRPIKRLMSLLEKGGAATGSRQWELKFLRSPREILLDSQGHARGVKMDVNRLIGDDPTKAKAEPTGESDELNAQLILRSIGYKSVPLEDTPFDIKRGRIPNERGRIVEDGKIIPGLYTSGWLKRGPTGVIATTMHDAYETAESIVQDQETLTASREEKKGAESILPLLQAKGIKPVSYSDWRALEALEFERGEQVGKPREKVTSVEEMLDIIQRNRA